VSLVLDCSATLAWLHDDERAPQVQRIFDHVVESGACVPGLWHLEVANALTMSVRRKRITPEQRDEFLAQLSNLDIQTDVHTAQEAWSATLRLADRHGLTVYDAAYLELAERRALPLATLDDDLRKAAEAAGVVVV